VLVPWGDAGADADAELAFQTRGTRGSVHNIGLAKVVGIAPL
jgi:hypothetical protein